MKRVVLGLMMMVSVLWGLNAHADLPERISQANQGDREMQYQLALDYQSGHNAPVSAEDAFYWLQQAAESGHKVAMITLAEAYLAGNGTEKDSDKALFWLTRALVAGNAEAALRIGQLYQSLPNSPSAQVMAEIWFHSVADSNAQAEQQYSQILEQRFNQQRARQVSSIAQMEETQQASAEEPTTIGTSTQSHTENLMNDYLVIVLIVLVVVALLSSYRYVRQAKRQQNTQQQEQLTTQLSEQTAIVKQQKRQLEKLYHEVKRLQHNQSSQQQDNKLALACALFGFHPGQLPDERGIKIRYKQLSKIYHPDMKGSEEEMKRLNGALKLIINHVNKSLQMP